MHTGILRLVTRLSELGSPLQLVFGRRGAQYSTAGPAKSIFPLTGQHQSRDLVEAIAPHDIAVLYGSHSGTSQELARRLTRELQWRFKSSVLLGSLDHFEYSRLNEVPPEKLTVFLMSSYGRGGPTKSAELFWDTLFDLQNGALRNLNFTVFGRGSSVYPTYNQAGIAVDAQLEQLGARRFSPYGQSDKIGGFDEEQFFEWKEALCDQIKVQLNKTEHPHVYEPGVDLKEASPRPDGQSWPEQSEEELVNSLTILSPEGLTPQYVPTIIKSSTDRDGRKFLHADFDLSRTPFDYNTGDYIVVWPENPAAEVDVFLRAFNLERKRHTAVIIDSKWKSTYEGLVRRYIGVSGIVSQELFKTVANFAPNELVRDRARALGNDILKFREARAEHVTIARLMLALSDGEPWPVPSTFILDSIPPLVPRSYSGSSSSLVEPHSASISLVVERFGHGSEGLATGYLAALEGSRARVAVAIQPSGFRLPEDPSVPVLLAGIGTGVAPFRGFVQEREQLAKLGENVGPTMLFLGTRHPESFLYKEFFEQAKTVRVFPAYSRAGDKEYVQDVILKNKEQVWEALQSGTVVYICGSVAKLKRHVRIAITKIIADFTGLSLEKAEKKFKSLKRQGRLYIDMW